MNWTFILEKKRKWTVELNTYEYICGFYQLLYRSEPLEHWHIKFKFSATWSCVPLRDPQLQVTEHLCYMY